jgi:hypothetical protein
VALKFGIRKRTRKEDWAAERALVCMSAGRYWDFSRINKREAKFVLSETGRRLPDLGEA